MARHSQKSTTTKKFVCTHCKEQRCGDCIDVARVVVADLAPICQCELPNHSGEPTLQQVADPFTGAVHGPAAKITEDGEVYVEPEWKQAFRELFREGDEPS